MKKLLLYSTLILALGACKNESSVKKDEKSTTPSTTGTESGSGTTTTSGSSTTTSSGSWSSSDKSMFLSTCTDAAVKQGMEEGKAKNYCSCMLDKIEVMYPNSQDAGKMTTNETTEMARECLK